MRKKDVSYILGKLDQVYGVTKEGFYHQQPWQLLAAIMLSAQSTDKQVEEVLPQLFQRFQTVEQMAEAALEEIEDSIRSIGLYKNKARNLKKCCRQIADEYGGEVPMDIDGVLNLAGRCLRNSWGHGGYPCIPHFQAAGLGHREKSGRGGSGIAEDTAKGPLEPNQFSADLSWQDNLYGKEGKVRGMRAKGMV